MVRLGCVSEDTTLRVSSKALINKSLALDFIG